MRHGQKEDVDVKRDSSNTTGNVPSNKAKTLSWFERIPLVDALVSSSRGQTLKGHSRIWK